MTPGSGHLSKDTSHNRVVKKREGDDALRTQAEMLAGGPNTSLGKRGLGPGNGIGWI
ncbi:high-affinity nickel-transporter [Anopheles sinensis]|uniref:High-affinity nickel-transporter n=1 Tax=Anopheles sinensis TaxID=74873 RepID=A0A084VK94_ANOSI|nr:high-affinity nickel-transporter [Anopheles sinensis]